MHPIIIDYIVQDTVEDLFKKHRIYFIKLLISTGSLKEDAEDIIQNLFMYLINSNFISKMKIKKETDVEELKRWKN